MTESVNIRAAVPSEAEFLSALAVRSKAYWGYPDSLVRSFAAELTIQPDKIEGQNFDYVVAEYSSTVVGFYALERESSSEFELDALFVDPEHIGTGLGRRLMRHAIDTVRAKGGETLVIQGDPNVEDFYLAAGAIRIGDRESESVPGRFLPLFRIDVGASRVTGLEAARTNTRSFSFSDAAARRIRRGAILPLFLIVPFATIYGLDPSKSQPMHFLITFTIGVVCAAVVVSISWQAAKRRIAELAKTSLLVGDGKLEWTSSMGQTDLDLTAVTSIVVQRSRKSIRSMTLVFADRRRVDLDGFDDMEILLASLRSQVAAELFETRKWYQI